MIILLFAFPTQLQSPMEYMHAIVICVLYSIQLKVAILANASVEISWKLHQYQ